MIIYKDMDQNSHEWWEARNGIVTASQFGQILNQKQKLKADLVADLGGTKEIKALKLAELQDLAIKGQISISEWQISEALDIYTQLAAEIVAGHDPDPWEGNAHMEHGKDAEDEAVKLYEEETGFTCQKVGFITDDERTCGCSPDRLVGDNGLMEIKSPKAKNMIKYFLEYKQTGKCPADFYLQIQGQLMLSEREWCDLVLFHWSLGVKIIRVFPDLHVHDNIKHAVYYVNKMRDDTVLIMTGI